MSEVFEHKDGSGTLLKNTFKGDNEKAPDYKGGAKVNGENVDMSAWIQTDKNGKKYMSIKFQPPYQKEAPKTRSRDAGDDDEPLPF